MAKKKILLADDESMVRLLVATTIEHEDYVLSEAATGDEALALIEREAHDLVLLDVSMPGTNGFEVCRIIKANPRTAGTKVVMLTAHGQEADRLLGEEVGADHYIIKPFSPLELLRKLRELLGP